MQIVLCNDVGFRDGCDAKLYHDDNNINNDNKKPGDEEFQPALAA